MIASLNTNEEVIKMTEREQMLITKYDLLFESRLAKTETGLENAEKNLANAEKNLMDAIKSINWDLRWMFGIFMGVDIAMLGLMAKGFKWFAQTGM
jgi:hypothetical protein